MNKPLRPVTAVAVIALLGALAACATTSVPMHFYVLTPLGAGSPGSAGGSGSGASSGDAAPEIRVQRVTIPGELDRPQIVYGAAGNQLQIAEQDRWAAPLDEMIRRVLNEDLARGGDMSADARGRNSSAAPRGVTLEIEELMAGPDCAVSLRATWALGTTARSGGTISFKAPGASNACAAADVPAAISAALGTLSERLRDAVAKSARTNAAPG